MSGPAGADPTRSPAGRARASGARLVEYALVLAMFVGSLALWIAVPVASLWLASLVSDDATTVGLAVLVVCPLAMIAFSFVLTSLYSLYLRVSGAAAAASRAAWLGSLSGNRAPREPRPVLDACLTISALIALVLLAVWFFGFAEGSRPVGPLR